VEPLSERERDLILLALMKQPSDENKELLAKLSDPTATLTIQRPRQRKSRAKPGGLQRVAG
jgi:hypothetical protein